MKRAMDIFKERFKEGKTASGDKSSDTILRHAVKDTIGTTPSSHWGVEAMRKNRDAVQYMMLDGKEVNTCRSPRQGHNCVAMILK